VSWLLSYLRSVGGGGGEGAGHAEDHAARHAAAQPDVLTPAAIGALTQLVADTLYDLLGAASAERADHELDFVHAQLHAAAHAIDGANHTGVLADAQIPASIARDAELHAELHSIIGADHNDFPGGTTTFLRADGSFAAPPGGGEAFPVGSVFIAVVATNPATLLGYGTWAAFAAGRMLVGLDAGQAEFDTVEETGGAKTHTLVEAEMPAHVHNPQRYPTATGGSTSFTVDTSMSGTPAATTLDTASKGGGGAHNNLPPYVVVYMWKRTA
jgi:hypothetical protein